MIDLRKNKSEETPQYNGEPTPDAIGEDGMKIWIIKDFKICAKTYQEALRLLPYIENCCR